MNDARLRPRAVAVLVALRKGSRSTADLRRCIADSEMESVLDLLHDLSRRGPQGLAFVFLSSGCGPSWRLTSDGLGWLQTNGLDATAQAKVELFGTEVQP